MPKIYIVVDYSIQVKRWVLENFIFIYDLEEGTPYTFSVEAHTKNNFGPAVVGNVITGYPSLGPMGEPMT